jgi:glycosyltransferase involved in cell wall biosynthesis
VLVTQGVAFPSGARVQSPRPAVALAHDYATQMGGAERVALIMAGGFPGAPLYVSLYHPSTTFPEFASLDLHTSHLDRLALFRRYHRLALPLLPVATSSTKIDADVTLISSTGWAHGVQVTGRKVVYCHAPARWLYQTDRYIGSRWGADLRGRLYGMAVAAAARSLAQPLRRWDRTAAFSADRYLVNSSVTRHAVEDAYGIEAEVLPPPPALLPGGPERPVDGVEPGFLLCVARLLPYKNVDAVIEAVRRVPGARLVVVGEGPDNPRLTALAAKEPRITLAGRIQDDQLRWLYRNSAALVAASFEDYGLSPLEAASFASPTVALRAGGYLDTTVEGVTGVFFDSPEPEPIAAAIEVALAVPWHEDTLLAHAEAFGAARFVGRLKEIVDDERLLL